MYRIVLLIIFFFPIQLWAQVTGGESVLQFLRLSPCPKITALGGMNIVHSSANDVSLAMQNPAMLTPQHSNMLVVNHNFFLSSTAITNLYYAKYLEKKEVMIAGGINYLNYGKFTRTDIFGNNTGDFLGNSNCIYLSVAKKYMQKWRWGATLKYASTRLDKYWGSALMGDFGIVYADTSNGWYFASLVKNLGFNVKSFSKGNFETLPFDFQIAMHKKLSKSPLRLGVLLHHLYEWDIRYDNPADIVNNNLFGANTIDSQKHTIDKILRHAVFSADIILSKRIEFSFGYNHARRGELNVTTKQAMSGFSYGVGVNLGKFQIRYARSINNIASNYNEIGINLNMHSTFGLGKATYQNLTW